MKTREDAAATDWPQSMPGGHADDLVVRLTAALRLAQRHPARHLLMVVRPVGPRGPEAIALVLRTLDLLVRRCDCLAQVDEAQVALLMEDCPISAGLRVARSLRMHLRRHQEGGRERGMEIGIGLVTVDGRCSDAATALALAEDACREAVRLGAGRIAVGEPRPGAAPVSP